MADKKRIIQNLEDFEAEAGMLPDLSRKINIQPENDLEAHFFDVADKHDVFESMLDELDEEEPEY